ncbi:MAG: lipid-A-disaccharide synthase [Flavobacteriales bacterium]
MKYYIIAGEVSGDLHGSNLMKEIKKCDENATFRVWGGDRMQAVGGELVKHINELAFMGFTEVLKNIGKIYKNINLCKKDILDFSPDAVILIDYPGFNLRIAEYIHKKGFKVFYYISPQIWAWKKSRVNKVRKFVDKMFVILPFEKEFYKKNGCDVEFVGHPLLDAISDEKFPILDDLEFREKYSLSKKPIIAVIPGSRKQEISKMLPSMLKGVRKFDSYQIVVTAAPSIPESVYKKYMRDDEILIGEDTYSVMKNAHGAVVTSGTATLETALFNTPLLVCYSGGRISYTIARYLVDVDHISLVNLIMEKEVVKELIQEQMNSENIQGQLERVLSEEEYRKTILNDLEKLREKLGGSGASSYAAKKMLEELR